MHLFQYPQIDKMTCFEDLNNKDNWVIKQIILEITERCNLRCDYCIYGDSNEGFRSFGEHNMEWSIAQRALDYALNNSGNDLAVTFYGGEPLLNFGLLKKCIEYVNANAHNKEIAFNMTSNLVLMDREKAEYFASLGNFSITCSLDGPQEIQDAHRKFPNGKGSFEYVIRGLRNLVKTNRK